MDDLDTRIKEANDLMVNEVEEAEVVSTPQGPVDLYEQDRIAFREATPRTSRGAKPKLKLDLSALDTIKTAYRKARDDSDYYDKTGNKQYARMVRQQYMQDQFLPVVDALVRLNGVGALLTSPEVLAELDAETLLEGTRGSGYTKSLLASLYAQDEPPVASDGQVKHALREIRGLCENDQIRAAVGKANDIKRRIDAGENVADEQDYQLIQKVALYGQ